MFKHTATAEPAAPNTMQNDLTKDHPASSKTFYNIRLYKHLGKLIEALQMYPDAFDKEQSFFTDHTNPLTTEFKIPICMKMQC